MKNEKPLEILRKKVDLTKNRLIIPRYFVKKYGEWFSMEVYKDKIIIKPIKDKEI